MTITFMRQAFRALFTRPSAFHTVVLNSRLGANPQTQVVGYRSSLHPTVRGIFDSLESRNDLHITLGKKDHDCLVMEQRMGLVALELALHLEEALARQYERVLICVGIDTFPRNSVWALGIQPAPHQSMMQFGG